MPDHIKQIIKDRAESIRKEIANSRLYGEPIDMDNANMVLVAAVCLEEQKRFMQLLARWIPTESETK